MLSQHLGESPSFKILYIWPYHKSKFLPKVHFFSFRYSFHTEFSAVDTLSETALLRCLDHQSRLERDRQNHPGQGVGLVGGGRWGGQACGSEGESAIAQSPNLALRMAWCQIRAIWSCAKYFNRRSGPTGYLKPRSEVETEAKEGYGPVTMLKVGYSGQVWGSHRVLESTLLPAHHYLE